MNLVNLMNSFNYIKLRCIVFNTDDFLSVCGNQSSKTLRVGAFKVMPNQVNETFEICNEFSELLTELGCRLGFQFSFQFPREQLGGHRLPNDSYNGGMGLIFRNESDLLLAPMALESDRMLIAEPTSYLFVGNLLATIDSYKPVRNNLLSILCCFRWDVWLLLVTFFVVYSFLNASKRKLLQDSFLYHYAVIVKQSFNLFQAVRKKRYCRLLLTLWCFAALYLHIYFTNDMLANLTAQPKESIKNLGEILGSGVKPMIEEQGFAYTEILKHSALNSSFELMSYKEVRSLKTLNRLVKERAVLIADEMDIDMMVQSNPELPLHKGEEGQLLFVGSILLNKALDGKTKTEFTKFTQKLQESGLFKERNLRMTWRIYRPSFASPRKAILNNDVVVDAIDLNEIRIVFVIQGLGTFMATLGLIYETIRTKM